jgi:hypothetical protein
MAAQTPATTHTIARSLIGSVGVLFCHFICFVVLAGILLKIAPRYEVIFKDRGVMLPASSILVINLSHWMSYNWYLLVPVLVLDGIIHFFLLRLSPRLNWLAAVWAFLIMVFAVVLLGVIAIGLCLPLQQIAPQHGALAERVAG